MHEHRQLVSSHTLSAHLLFISLQVVHELIERFEAHLIARQYFSVIANMKGTSPEEVASRLLNVPGLEGLQVCGCGCVQVLCCCMCMMLEEEVASHLLNVPGLEGLQMRAAVGVCKCCCMCMAAEEEVALCLLNVPGLEDLYVRSSADGARHCCAAVCA